MIVELTPEMEIIISDRLSSGRNPSAQAVLEDAFSALQLRDSQQGSPAPPTTASRAAFPDLSQEERERRAKGMEELFAQIRADGPLEPFEIERHNGPPDQREPWLT